MDTLAIMADIDTKREELRRLSRAVWGAPRHIAEEIEPRIVALNLEIDALKAQLWRETNDNRHSNADTD